MSKRPVVTTTPSADVHDVMTKNQLAQQLQILLDTAYELGYVITVETTARLPLAMGNYKMCGNVRGAR